MPQPKGCWNKPPEVTAVLEAFNIQPFPPALVLSRGVRRFLGLQKGVLKATNLYWRVEKCVIHPSSPNTSQ